MSLTPPSPQAMYVPPVAPPPAAPALQQPQGSPGQFGTQSGTGAGGTPSFMSNAAAAPAPTQTGQRSLLGS
jgi:hypothetical protein